MEQIKFNIYQTSDEQEPLPYLK